MKYGWCGDSSAGPWLKTPDGRKRRVYVIALIDDASRFILGADVFFHDTFVNLMSVMKSAVSKYGKPRFLTLITARPTKTGRWNCWLPGSDL